MTLEENVRKEILEKVTCTKTNCDYIGDKPVCYTIFYEDCSKYVEIENDNRRTK